MTMQVEAHHVKAEPCRTRPKYREGKKPKVVKVYTCAQESKYLLVQRIPALGLQVQLAKLFAIYGSLEEMRMLDAYPCGEGEFHDAALVKFAKIQNARTAKLKLDDYGFYGSSLHVCYAPEFESLDEVREKLAERRTSVTARSRKYEASQFGTLDYERRMRAGGWRLERNKLKKQETLKRRQQADPAPLVCFPKLPDDWLGGGGGNVERSLEQTADEIDQQLKRTQPVSASSLLRRTKRRKVLKM